MRKPAVLVMTAKEKELFNSLEDMLLLWEHICKLRCWHSTSYEEYKRSRQLYASFYGTYITDNEDKSCEPQQLRWM